VKISSGDPALLVGLETPDDAAVYRVSDDVALVQTVDFFTPIVDDPFDWGRIAAANALSDVYAMGGTPLTALNLVGWPRALEFDLLGRVLEGGAKICDEAGVAVVGGHSVDDPEPKFGLAVTGTVHPNEVVRNTGAAPGAELVLTKPLGTGIVSTALKQGIASDAAVAEAVASMTELNRAGADAMLETGVMAATDVTGFGLIGHLLEMLTEGQDAEIEALAVPMLTEAVDLAEQGVYPGGSERNLTAGSVRLDVDGVADPVVKVLFDAQTSGGLLIAVEPAKTDALMEGLQQRGVRGARIGRIVAGAAQPRVAVR
jgi:selenide, water dikinase